MVKWADGPCRRPARVVRRERIDDRGSYLLAGAPSFDQSISQFREKFNADNPKLPLNEFRSIATSRDRANLTRAASKINENLYASTALERGTLKIKSMQITGCRSRGRSKRRPGPKRWSI
nr:Protein of uncharacterised function (DUF1454) [Klebsiella pneumoniae]